MSSVPSYFCKTRNFSSLLDRLMHVKLIFLIGPTSTLQFKKDRRDSVHRTEKKNREAYLVFKWKIQCFQTKYLESSS